MYNQILERHTDLISSVQQIFSALARNDNAASANELIKLAHLPNSPYPRNFLLSTSKALTSGDWDEVGHLYSTRSFYGKDGDFIFIAPLALRRNGAVKTFLSGIAGVIDVDIEQHISAVRNEISEWFAYRGYLTFPLGEEIAHIIPVRPLTALGAIGQEGGEAFLVPDAWRIPGAGNGPALLDLTEQSARFATKGRACIHRIFESSTAELLIDAVSGPQADLVRALEYSLHDAGHSTGTGLKAKIKNGFFRSLEDKSSEEFHATGLEYWAIDHILSTSTIREILPFHPGRLVASSFCTMFGMDSHRVGGMERDVDVRATLKIFHHLIHGDGSVGPALIRRNGKLALEEPSYDGLIKAVRPFADSAWELVQKELRIPHGDQLISKLQALYRGLEFSPFSRESFNELVIGPCRGIYQQLN